MMRNLVIPLIAVACAGFASAADVADPNDTMNAAEKPGKLTARDQKTYDKLFNGKVTGEPRNCLPNAGYTRPIPVGENVIAFRRGNIVYRNNLRSACTGLDDRDDILILTVQGGNVCKNDQINRISRTNGVSRSRCVLGEFVPYTEAAKDADENQN